MISLVVGGRALVSVGASIPGEQTPSDEIEGTAGLKFGVHADVILFLDHFLDVNGTLLNSHTMDIGAGWSLGGGFFEIQSNRATWTSGERFAATETEMSDVTITVIMGSNDGYGLCARVTDADNGIAAYVDGSILWLQQIEAGSFTLLDAQVVGTLSGDYTLQLRVHGDTVEAEVLEVEVICTATGVTFNETETLHGLFSSTAVGGNWGTWLVSP